jgi:hypothetical protein
MKSTLRRLLIIALAALTAATMLIASGCSDNGGKSSDSSADSSVSETEKPKAENNGDYDKVKYEEDDGELVITGVKDKKLTTLTVPSAIGGKTVKAIGEAAFAGNKKLKKVTISDGGSGEPGVNSVGGYVPSVLAKTIETMKEVTGLDLVDVMRSETYDAKVNRNITVSGVDAGTVKDIIE